MTDALRVENRLAEFREMLVAYRGVVTDRGKEFKEPMYAFEKFSDLFESLGPNGQVLMTHVLKEWSASEDASLRWDADALLKHFKLHEPVLAGER